MPHSLQHAQPGSSLPSESPSSRAAAGKRLAVYVQPAVPPASPPARERPPRAETQLRSDVTAACRAALPPAAVPAAAVVLGGGLPRSAGGKVVRGELPEPDWNAATGVRVFQLLLRLWPHCAA